MNILAIETSCDESSVALLQTTTAQTTNQTMSEINQASAAVKLYQCTASQIDVHRVTGGVVPEVAAREPTAGRNRYSRLIILKGISLLIFWNKIKCRIRR